MNPELAMFSMTTAEEIVSESAPETKVVTPVFRSSPPPPVTVEVSETIVTVKSPSNEVPSSEPEPVPVKM